MTCQRIGRLPTGIIGLGATSDASRIRRPCPPQKMTTFTAPPPPESGRRSAPPTRARRSSWATISSLRFHGQDQDVVGTSLLERLRMPDRDVGPGQELALLVRVAVDRELEQVGADAAVVEQRVALAGRAVAGDPLALASACDQELEQAPLRLLDLSARTSRAPSSVSKPSVALARRRASSTRGLDRPAPVDRRCA